MDYVDKWLIKAPIHFAVSSFAFQAQPAFQNCQSNSNSNQ